MRHAMQVHCLAAEPHETFVRVAVENCSDEEVAFETAVLGRLRPGYRVLQLRSRLGTRIERCFLFVKISMGEEPHQWASREELRQRNNELRRKYCESK